MRHIIARPSRRSLWHRAHNALTRRERRRLAGLLAVVIALHVVGFGLLFAAGPIGGAGALGIGVGITAYTLGLRHAFDADHIGAIDNTTRKLIADGQRPLGVGFFFALGHSSIVVLLAVLFSVGVRGLSGAVEDEGSSLQQATGLIGPTISGAFLLLIGLLNLVILRNTVRVFRRMRAGDVDERDLEGQLHARGAMTRLYQRAGRTIGKSWHMYPLGWLFGLGFDTATEVALLFLAAGAAGAGLPVYAILCLPILFAAGMALFDTLDGVFMTFAYGRALSKPVRKVFYNLTITALSVAVALIVGTVELLSVFAARLELHGGPWDVVATVDLNLIGYLIVALFVLTWVVALAVWRYGRIEERFATQPARSV